MQLSIRGHHQFDLPGQRQRLRFRTGFLTKGVLCMLVPSVTCECILTPALRELAQRHANILKVGVSKLMILPSERGVGRGRCEAALGRSCVTTCECGWFKTIIMLVPSVGQIHILKTIMSIVECTITVLSQTQYSNVAMTRHTTDKLTHV